MKAVYSILTVFMVLHFLAPPSQAAVVWLVSASVDKIEEGSLNKKHLQKTNARLEHKRERYDKRLKRLERKIRKRGWSGEEQSQDFWDDSKFRLGLLLLLVAIGLGVIGAIISLGGLFSFMAGLFALGGIILLIWSLVEAYG